MNGLSVVIFQVGRKYAWVLRAPRPDGQLATMLEGSCWTFGQAAEEAEAAFTKAAAVNAGVRA